MSSTVIVILSFVGLMLVGMPLFAAVGLTAAIALYLIDIPLTLLAQTAFTSLQPFPLLTIPLFILAGKLMELGGMSSRMISIAQTLVGAYRGSMAMVTIFACALFAALSGSGPATTAAIGSITIPEMKRQGYRARFAAAVSASAGALGSMIPPSNLMIIYCLVAQESIPRMFLAGILPGFGVALLLLIVAYVVSAVNNYGGGGESFSIKPLMQALWDGKWAIFAPFIILGGIYSGVFTPTEAASVALFYSLFVGLFVYRELTWERIAESLRFTALLTGILIIIAPSFAFGQIMALYDLPQTIEAGLSVIAANPIIVMIIIGVILIIVGTFMESLAQVVLFTPIFLPGVEAMGIDPLVFGIFMVMSCEIGFLTPPLGGNLFIAARLSNVSMEQVSIGVLPLILPYLAIMMLIVLVPTIVTFIPDLVYGPQP
ncbi:TRAP transporter large permease [Halomonas denitrificans]|uniref:TRAP transporter large permease n=1 Tax=Halomonas denitrificans TaxID=370769 RepID=UPI001CD2E4A5|nr:TRAP transporter large permease [Halomonas denitrificans]MCA0976540.1 TRAP transporter large permease [Halomonas denitrificans]